ncbi:hypothetical protein Moror_6005 [Moniliophthora roreri MCA 2997]|uniref:Uncharacterized protein n=2 Tax=Moniliophthora roreri TaxID=221103 RepID=V2WLT2_MONRO|nr:hypothetical protein Moror_6005 [Moniliophthora roreri MCA 2997]
MVTAVSLQLNGTVAYLALLALLFTRVQELFMFFERWYLELQAALDWVQLCIPAIEKRTSNYDASMLSSVTGNAIGAFMDSLKDCEQLFRARIPVWYVWPIMQHPTTRVDYKAIPLSPEQLNIQLEERPDHPRLIVFVGECSDTSKACAIELYGHKIVDFPDLFQSVPDTSVSLVSSTIQTSSSAGPSCLKKHRSKGQQAPYKLPDKTSDIEKQQAPEQDKFIKLRGEYSLDVANVWVNAVRSINWSSHLKNTNKIKINGGYALPDPGMILWQAYRLDNENKSKLIQYLKSVGHLRDPDLIKEIMYELYELNFQMELYALNWKMALLNSAALDGTSEWYILDNKVQACFPGPLGPHDPIMTIHWLKSVVGLSSKSLKH